MTTSIIVWLIALVAWFVISKVLAKQWLAWEKSLLEQEIINKKQESEQILSRAEKESQKILDIADKNANDIRTRAEKESNQIAERMTSEAEKRQEKLDQTEDRLTKKEEKLDQRMEKIDAQKEELTIKKTELNETLEKQKTILSDLAKISPEEAKKQLFDKIEKDNQAEIKRFIHKYKTIKEEEAKEEAAKIICKVMPRVAQEWLNEFLVSHVDLPNEEMKGKIIGREWRNISAFERVTGVEVVIDDTPLTLKISCFESERRFIAVETMKRLIKDGRINPVYIEKMYEEVVASMEERFMKKWKEALTRLNLSMMKPEVVIMIGRFFLRSSYGQNLWVHSLEVAKLSEMLANELGLNADLAKKAWLLHDIGKIEAGNGETHTKVWAAFLRKHKMHDVIINTAEAHHFDTELLYPEAWVVTAADAISASRLWARRDTKELFIERMWALESLVTGIPGIEKAFIMQAGREIMAFFNPDEVDDITMEKMTADIWKKIEDQLDYPGSIRIVGIREKKMTHFLR